MNNDASQISKCETCLQTGLINNTYLLMENMILVCGSSDDEGRRNTVGTIQSRWEEERRYFANRSKYHLIPSESNCSHAWVTQPIKHTKKINIHYLDSWTLDLLHKLIRNIRVTRRNLSALLIDSLITSKSLSMLNTRMWASLRYGICWRY